MTREEAIYRLRNCAWLGTNKDREETEQAVEVAVKALCEYEKMKDLAEQYKFEYECVFESLKEVLNEVLPNRVEVVRCEDCKWYDNIGCALIIVDEEDRPKHDDYCSYGERKNND